MIQGSGSSTAFNIADRAMERLFDIEIMGGASTANEGDGNIWAEGQPSISLACF